MTLRSEHPWVRVADLGAHAGETVTLRGWVRNHRSSGKIQFIELRDGSGIVQVVVGKRDVDEETFERAAGLTQESSIEVTGLVREDARSPIGVEVHLRALKVYQVASDYPITKKEHGTAFLMEHRHLWLRSRRQQAILRVRASLIRAIRDFFDDRGYLLLDTPILTPAACEGTTTLFEVDYFSEPAYLSQSGQLYNEATAAAFTKSYCFGPTFRAEKSKTRRHLTEFWMVEPEMAFFDLEDDIDEAEAFVCYIVARVLEERRADLLELERDTAPLERVVPPFPRVHYDDAIAKLRELGSDIEWGSDFGGDDETVLTQQYDRPIVVHHFPTACKAFYMKHEPERPELSCSMDVLAPEGYGEIVGGGEREINLEVLENAIAEHQLPAKAFSWYLDLRRYGSVPHAGFGLGLERTLAWICGLKHVRESIPFPRLLERMIP